MLQPNETIDLANELHQLLVAAALGDATDVQIARLNELLLGDEQRRHQAARFFEEEAVLRREFTMLDRVVDFHRPMTKDHAAAGVESARDAHCAGTVLGRIGQRLFLAVALLLSASIVVVLLVRSAGTSASKDVVDGVRAGGPPITDDVDIALSNHRILPVAASILTPVTHVSWSGPQFSTEPVAPPPTAKIREGIVSFVSAFGRPAKGYMVCLPPGALFDVVIVGDAEGENALAVIEFDAYGRPTGRRVSFSNSAGEGTTTTAVDAKFSPLTKKGRLGICTESNDSTTPRYYLFTGVHKLFNRSADDSWHVSELTAFIEQPGLVHLGWDDSGMPTPGDKNLVQHPDHDFDDVTATVRIRTPNAPAVSHRPALAIYSKTVSNSVKLDRQPATGAERYTLSIAPGQVAVLKVCSRSDTAVDVSVFDQETNKLHWRCTKADSTTPNLGICAIENHSDQARSFYLVGFKQQPEKNSADPTAPLEHSILFEQEQFVTVGFDDGDQLATDFYKVRVDILTMDAF